MNKIKLLTPLSTTALIGSVLPITSCSKKTPEIVQHTITFSASEGIDLSGKTPVKVNDKTKWKDVTKPTVSSKIPDFQILGWYNGPEEISDETEITSDITAKCVGYDPRATFNEVTIVTAKAEYKDNTFIQGGTWGGFKTYYEITQDPEKEGFTFDGWYVDDTKINDDYVFPVGQLTATVTAKFIENKKTVSFAKTEGVTFNPETPDPVEVESGTTWGEVDKPTATVDTENYYDLGWYIDGQYTKLEDTTPITSNITAKYCAIKRIFQSIDVTLKIDGESNQLTFYQTGSWADFKALYGIQDPVKEGYDFIGWYVGEDKIDETSYTFPAQSSITIEAKFKIKQVSVTFTKTDGVTFTGSTDPVEVDPNTLWKDVNKPTAIVDTENYWDLGWYIDGQYTKLEDTTPITSNITAKYCAIAKSEVLIQVTLKIDGESNQLTFYQGGTWADFKAYYGIKDPVKEGYDFIGWYVGETKIDESSYTFPTQSSIAIEAKFRIKQFSVIFTTDAGAEFTEPVAPIYVNPNTTWSAIKKPSLKIKEGFIGDGWCNKKGGKMTDDTPITSDTEVIYRTIDITTNQVKVTIKVLEKTYDPVIFVQGKTWKEFKDSYIPKDPEQPGYRFNYWTYNGEKISDDWHFPTGVKEVTIEANFEFILKPSISLIGHRNGERKLDTKWNEDFQYNNTQPGYDSGSHKWLNPEFENNVLRYQTGQNCHDSRLIISSLKIEIPVEPHSTKNTNLNIKTWVHMSIGKYGGQSITTCEVFKLNSESDHPEFYTNLDNETDSRKHDQRCAGYNGNFLEHLSGKYDFEYNWDAPIMQYTDVNDSDQIKVFTHYVSVSFLVRGRCHDDSNISATVTYTFNIN